MRLSYRSFAEGYIFPEDYTEISIGTPPTYCLDISRDVRGTVFFRMEEKNSQTPRVVNGTVFDAENKPIAEIREHIIHNNEWFTVPEDVIKYGDPQIRRSAMYRA